MCINMSCLWQKNVRVCVCIETNFPFSYYYSFSLVVCWLKTYSFSVYWWALLFPFFRYVKLSTRHRLWLNQNIMLNSTLNMKIRKIWNSFELLRLCMPCTSIYPKTSQRYEIDVSMDSSLLHFSVVLVQCFKIWYKFRIFIKCS